MQTKQIDPVALADIEKFERLLAKYLAGDLEEDVFRIFRLNNGIYGQRQQGHNQMVRIKLPYGAVNPAQMRVLADASERFTNGISHITTRQAIAEAWRWNEEGAGDPLDKAEIYRADAAYAETMGEFETAESILEKALTLYLAVGDAHLQGKTLIQMAKTVGYLDPEKGLTHIGRALELINPVREPRLGLCAQHHLAWFLSAAGRPRDALGVLDRARPLYEEFPDDFAQLRLHWLQGRVAHALGQFAEAAAILRQVREEFCARDQQRNFLMISIDLAEAHVAARETATALSFLEETTPILAGWNLHRNALAAWLTFQKTLEERRDQKPTALAPLFDNLRRYYRRSWYVPAAEFAIG